MKMIGSAK